MAVAVTSGVLFVHSSPRALCPHIEWAVEGILGARSTFEWTPQPAGPDLVRAEMPWQGSPGTGASLASAFLGWERMRYEVTEDPSRGQDGGRWSHTPDLGIFYAVTDVCGNILIPEDRIRSALAAGASDAYSLRAKLEIAMGQAWDDELEPFRHAADGAPVRWMHWAANQ